MTEMRLPRMLLVAFGLATALMTGNVKAQVARSGNLQVTADSGIRVLVDRAYKGRTTLKEDGLFVANLAVGLHSVRLERDGFESQEFRVEIVALRTAELRVQAFRPALRATDTGAGDSTRITAQTARLVVTTVPLRATIELDGRSFEKRGDELRFDNLGPGRHTIVAVRGTERLVHRFVVSPGEPLRIGMDFRDNTVREYADQAPTVRFLLHTPGGGYDFLRNLTVELDGVTVFASKLGVALRDSPFNWAAESMQVRERTFGIADSVDGKPSVTYILFPREVRELATRTVAPGKHVWSARGTVARHVLGLDPPCAAKLGYVPDTLSQLAKPLNTSSFTWDNAAIHIGATVDAEINGVTLVHIMLRFNYGAEDNRTCRLMDGGITTPTVYQGFLAAVQDAEYVQPVLRRRP